MKRHRSDGDFLSATSCIGPAGRFNLKIGAYYRHLISFSLVIVLALTQVSCQPTGCKMEPTIVCPLPAYQIKSLPSAFPSPSADEKKEEWAKELFIGDAFAKECDFYRALTSYKRALFLLPPSDIQHRLQIDYNMVLCYYLGSKHQEAINIFEASDLSQVNQDFPGFHHLLLIIYDCYLLTEQEDKASCVLDIIRKLSSESSDDLLLYQTLKKGESEEARSLIAQHRNAQEMQADFALYDQFKKSPTKARTLNAILPGAGYYYVGQRRSALTSFIINTLFTAAAYQFFRNGYPAAGAITASLEAGWYLGGINGAGIEAQEFNTRLYEGMSRKILTDHFCFPVLMFETSF
ncbi:MAG: tetratricopeptide repeat protein [Parachlamydiaceae bacterium]